MPVFVKNSYTAFRHDAGKLFDQSRLIIHKRNNPAAPRKIVVALWQFALHQIRLMNFYVGERARAAHSFHRANEVLRTFERYYFTCWPNDLSQINGRVARTSSDVEHAFANRDTGSLPTLQNNWTPDTMLQPESG